MQWDESATHEELMVSWSTSMCSRGAAGRTAACVVGRAGMPDAPFGGSQRGLLTPALHPVYHYVDTTKTQVKAASASTQSPQKTDPSAPPFLHGQVRDCHHQAGRSAPAPPPASRTTRPRL